MATKTIVTRLATSMMSKTSKAPYFQSRALSSQGVVAVQKLRNILEHYRQENYTQEIPTRFKKEVLKAAQKDGTGNIDAGGMQRVLANIHMENEISSEEMDIIFHEIGGTKAKVPVEDMMKLL